MAIIKVKPYKFGINTEYWSIDEMNINFAGKTAHVVLFGYRSEDAKKVTQEEPTETISFDYSGDNFPFVKGENNMEKAYNEIKKSQLNENEEEQNFFVDAVDC